MSLSFKSTLLLCVVVINSGMLLADSSSDSAYFYYDPNDGGGTLSCNGVELSNDIPSICKFNAENEITIQRAAWSGFAVITESNIQEPKLEGACAGSVIVSELEHTYNLSPVCAGGLFPARQDATGTVLLDEWYTDLPWHQKLSTKDSNLIETPFVMPYAALPKNQCPGADTALEKARCMLRYGVVNIMAMHRTDTLYAPNQAMTRKDCQNDDCVEVKLKIQRLNTLTDNPEGYIADTIKNNTYQHTQLTGTVPSLGFAITEATIFAPWRPWYSGHYCVADIDNIADAVCYEDYFTTQLVAPANPAAEQQWLRDYPAIFADNGSQGIFTKFCAENKDACVMYLGKVDWLKNASSPEVVECKSGSISTCATDIKNKTAALDRQFNASIKKFPDDGRYPWGETAMNMIAEINNNPYIGFYKLKQDVPGNSSIASLYKAPSYALPKKCSKQDYYNARHGKPGQPTGSQRAAINKLDDCVLNFEVHTSGFHEQWRELWGGDLSNLDAEEISKAFVGIDANQYGRTMFMLAGLGEQHIPVSFRVLADGMSIYDKVYNASIYTQYIPLVNPAEQVLNTKSYDDPFWHAFFMSNHMNQTPDHFIRGIRGRTLWHNEYRSNFIYESAVQAGPNPRIKGTKFEKILGHVDFPAGFQLADASTEFHGNTCDACHLRNGGGVPLMPNGQLAQIHLDKGMLPNYKVSHDYTYSNKELPAMKMVLFDLKGDDASVNYYNLLDAKSRKTALDSPLSLYNNRIMNFYGDSFHVNQENQLPTYSMKYVPLTSTDGFELVAAGPRGETGQYLPRRVEISQVKTGSSCQGIVPKPDNVPASIWPRSCADVSGEDVLEAIENHDIGFMHLLGKRLGNTPMIEFVPDKIMLQAELEQAEVFESINYAGDVELVAGTRAGKGGDYHYRSCTSGEYGAGDDDCYIGRWGWVGDRASLEDQIANAAIVEMGISSINSFLQLHSTAGDEDELVRYTQSLCGPANVDCLNDQENSDISEQEIRDMATYQRWIGIPNRSEYQVSSKIVQQGEARFKKLHCDSCHIVDKIVFDEDDNMLPDEAREQLKKLQISSGNEPEYPFISYLGTDLLAHDMGYLSQVAAAPVGVEIRDTDGVIKQRYAGFIKKIRTPALKGLRFNRFVTDSNKNTAKVLGKADYKDVIQGCDFLLHDGRACDAIEATFLHDGPAFKSMGTIEKLNKLDAIELNKLRAFLYSL